MILTGYHIHNVLRAFTRRFGRTRPHANNSGCTDERMAADVKRQLIIDHVASRIIDNIRRLADENGRRLAGEDGHQGAAGFTCDPPYADVEVELGPFTFNVIDENNVKQTHVWDPEASDPALEMECFNSLVDVKTCVKADDCYLN